MQPMDSDALLEVQSVTPIAGAHIPLRRVLKGFGILAAGLAAALSAAATAGFAAAPVAEAEAAFGSLVGLERLETILTWKDRAGRCLTATGANAETTVALLTCNPALAQQQWVVDRGVLRYKAAPRLCLTFTRHPGQDPRYGVARMPCLKHSPSQHFVLSGTTIRLANDTMKCVADSTVEGELAYIGRCAFTMPLKPMQDPKPTLNAADKKVDAASRCSAPGEDCRQPGECCMQGMQCYVKDSSWAACQAVCDAGRGWDCTKLGSRTPMRTPGAWAGEDCTLVKKCNNPQNRCVQKDSISAYCTQEVPVGWSGEVLGGSLEEHAVAAAVADQRVAATTLFCFMAVLPGSKEEGLRQEAEMSKGSIYGCDLHQVYDSYPAPLVSKNDWNSYANTDSFVKVWHHVFAEALWRRAAWTVKVDPDTVFLPHRLRAHLLALKPLAEKPIYIKNTELAFGFYGSIEVISHAAVANLELTYVDCRRTMPGISGEDGWMKGCLDAVGVGYMTDINTLRTPHSTSCTDHTRVAFHPLKERKGWASCWRSATAG